MVEVYDIVKTFPLSLEQQKAQKKRGGFVTAVNGVSFTVNDGEIFSLLGPNGAGKTTTMRCISTLIKPDSGDIIVNGTRDEREIRKKMCFLTAELKPDENFTVDYLVTYFARLNGRTEEQIARKKAELYDELDIGPFCDKKVGKLSSGMRQKASIAINLIKDPQIIIFDEPTSGLDIISAREVTDYLLKLKQKGKTIIVSTHIMDVARRISDRIAVMAEGRIAACGTLEELYSLAQADNLDDAFFNIYRRCKNESV